MITILESYLSEVPYDDRIRTEPWNDQGRSETPSIIKINLNVPRDLSICLAEPIQRIGFDDDDVHGVLSLDSRSFRVKEVEFWVKKGFSAHVSAGSGSGGSIRRTVGEETIEEYMAQIRVDTGPGIVRQTFGDAVRFELKGHFLKELRENTFSGTDKHIDKVLEIVDLFHKPEVNEGQLMLRVFPTTLTSKACRWLKTIRTRSITIWGSLKT
ncbi:hypothetical protein Tco_0695992 [Tanacetum coccineum]